jgi:hypothetical protein
VTLGQHISSKAVELHAVAKRKRRRFAFGGARYELRAPVYDSFGEDAFEVKLRRL